MMGLVVIGSFRNGASQVANSNKELDSQCRRLKRQGFNPWVRKTPWRRAWQPTPRFLPVESHGQRSLAVHRVALIQTQLK